jgi:hypothetical protein
LGYGEEIVLLGEGGRLLYDIDFEDLLSSYTKDIGLTEGRTLTVVDDEMDRVNVEFIISEGQGLVVPEMGEIPKKPPQPKEEPNGIENGVENSSTKKRARDDDDDDDDAELRKRAKITVEGNGKQDIILIDEDDDTVMID